MRLRHARAHVVGGAPGGAIDGVYGALSWREGVLLELVDDDGHTGWGEASPLPGLSREVIADVRTALGALDPAAFSLDGSPILAVERALESIPRALPSARFALETALLDLLARARATSVAALLGAAPDARRELSALLAGDSADALARAATRAVGDGARTLKLKLDGRAPLEDAVARVRAVRAAAPAPVALRLDANATFDPDGVLDSLRALAASGVQLVEEPVFGRALLGLSSSAIPIAVDESLAHADATLRDALVAMACAVVLKPTVLGGVLACRTLAREAHSRGVPAIITHTLDGPIALAAACALALALPRGLAHGLAPHPALAAYPSAHVDAIDGFELATPATLGLGVHGCFGAAA